MKIVPKDSSNFVYVKLKVFADLRSANIKIIIADFFPSTARVVMCEAYKQVGAIFLVISFIGLAWREIYSGILLPNLLSWKKGQIWIIKMMMLIFKSL